MKFVIQVLVTNSRRVCQRTDHKQPKEKITENNLIILKTTLNCFRIRVPVPACVLPAFTFVSVKVFTFLTEGHK